MGKILSPEKLHAYIDAERRRQAELEAREPGVPTNVSLGPLASTVINNAKWNNQDKYPSFQDYADEFETLLLFAQDQGVHQLYFSKLVATTRQRDAALDELRVALHFDRNGFPILKWNPVGLPPKEGEYLISTPSATNVFVEVKSPTWQSELTQQRIDAGRTHEPKYQFCEGGAFALWLNIQYAIDKAYDKFSPALPNLLVIPGDGTFVSMRHGIHSHAHEALYIDREPYNGRFTTPAFQNLGGIAIFWMDGGLSPVEYFMKVFLNAYALVPLPQELAELFKIANTE